MNLPINKTVEPRLKKNVRKRTSANITTNHDSDTPCGECYVSIEGLPQSEIDKIEAHDAIPHGYTTGLTDTFVRVCKGLKLPMEQHTMYKHWCIQNHTNPYGGKLIRDDLPMEKNERGHVPKLAPNWIFPYPTGSKWKELNSHPDEDLETERAEYIEALYAEVCRDIKRQNMNEPMILSNQTTSFEVSFAYTLSHNANPTGKQNQNSQKEGKGVAHLRLQTDLRQLSRL